MSLPPNLYECSICFRGYVGDAIAERCAWCHSKGTVALRGASTAPAMDHVAWCHAYKAEHGRWPDDLMQRRGVAVKSAMLSAPASPSASKPVQPPAPKPAQNKPTKSGELR